MSAIPQPPHRPERRLLGLPLAKPSPAPETFIEQKGPEWIKTLSITSEVQVHSRKTGQRYIGVIKDVQRINIGGLVRRVILVQVNGESIRPFTDEGDELGRDLTRAAYLTSVPPHRRESLLQRELHTKVMKRLISPDALTVDQWNRVLRMVRQTADETKKAKTEAWGALVVAMEEANERQSQEAAEQAAAEDAARRDRIAAGEGAVCGHCGGMIPGGFCHTAGEEEDDLD